MQGFSRNSLQQKWGQFVPNWSVDLVHWADVRLPDKHKTLKKKKKKRNVLVRREVHFENLFISLSECSVHCRKNIALSLQDLGSFW